jgi:hypothetical protein
MVAPSLLVGLFVGAQLPLWLHGWQIAILLVVFVVLARRLAAKKRSRMYATPEEVAQAKMVPLHGKGVLSGIRVLELANTVAAPMMSRFLADLGAGK